MLKHNSQLRKSWNKAKKRKQDDYVLLDMRYKTSKDFINLFADYCKKEIYNSPQVVETIKAAIKYSAKSFS